MRTRIDAQLVRQVVEYRLRYCCESCGHFDDIASSCSLGYPEQPHRRRELAIDRELVFCKEFDLA